MTFTEHDLAGLGVTRAAIDRVADHMVAAHAHDNAIRSGKARQPRYFYVGRPGIEETRGVAYAPSSAKSSRRP